MAIAVEGLDLHRAPDDRLAHALRQALLDNLVLCIRGQSIGPGDYLATIATFGEPLVRPGDSARARLSGGHDAFQR